MFKNRLLFLLTLLGVFGVIFWALFDTHIIKPDGMGNLVTGESTYGDLPFHLSTISQIAYGRIFPPQNPFLAGAPLIYPYLINVVSAILVTLGVSLRDSIIIPGMVLSLLTVVLLYFFYEKASKNKSVAFLATVLFLLNGGLGFYFFIRDVLGKNLLSQFLVNPVNFPDYSHLFGENIQWNNYVSRILVPERSVLLGIPLGLIILYLLFLSKEKLKIRNVLIAAVLMGILPLAHTHTFLVFGLAIPLLALCEIDKKDYKGWLIRWFSFGVITLLVASFQLMVIFNHVEGGGGFLHYHIGWMAKPGFGEFVLFWFKNAGILIPLMFISFFIKRVTLFTKRLVLISFIILIIVNLFLFQPYDWDNIKFLFWVSLFGNLGAASVLVSIWNRRIFGKIVTVILFFSLISSALLSLYREVGASFVLFSREEVDLGQWVRKNTPESSVFLTAPIHNSFVSNLGGRRILMGYPGLLWVHGINYSRTEKDLMDIYQGRNVKDLLAKHAISYIVLGPEEINVLKANVNYFFQNFCLIHESLNYKIFEVKGCTKRL